MKQTLLFLFSLISINLAYASHCPEGATGVGYFYLVDNDRSITCFENVKVTMVVEAVRSPHPFGPNWTPLDIDKGYPLGGVLFASICEIKNGDVLMCQFKDFEDNTSLKHHTKLTATSASLL